jgi:hypothetical protein
VALGDIDGDGNLDAFVTNTGASNRVYLGNGAGGFSTVHAASLNVDESMDVALGDLDNQ